jgi:hypothetical protein
MATATLYKQHDLSRLRPWPPRCTALSAVVLERPGGYRLVTRDQPIDPISFIGGRFRRLFRVNLAPLEVTQDDYELPSSELARSFLVDFRLTVEVEDALKVVREQKTEVWDAIEPVLRLPLRRIGRGHAPEQVAEVEEALHQHLSARPVPEVGLRVVRAGVTARLEGPDLKRERDKIEDRHRRELDEQNTRFRVRLEKEEAQHQRVLERLHAQHRRELEDAREQHQRNLEDQRRRLYEQVIGEGVLPELLLIRLAARPAGGDPKEIDEVIELMKQAKVDDFRVPLELLARYTDGRVLERWQLEEYVTTLLRRLATTFEPTLAPPPKVVEQVEAPSTESGARDDDGAAPPDDQGPGPGPQDGR